MLQQELSFTEDMSQRTAVSLGSEFREKWVYHAMEIGYVLSQVIFYSNWIYRNVNKFS